MESVIEDLYNGDLCPSSQFHYTLDDIRKKWEELDQVETDFMDNLSEPMQEQFDNILDRRLEMANLDLTQAYVEGFKLGAKLLIEVLTSDSFTQPKQS